MIRIYKRFQQVRHAKGFHNVAGEKVYEAFKSYDYLDASLTALGWEQVVHGTNHYLSFYRIHLSVNINFVLSVSFFVLKG